MANVSIDIDGTDIMSNVLIDLVNQFPGLNGRTITFSTLDDSSGIGFFPGSGAAIVTDRESITGHVEQKCQYPFLIVYKAAPKTESQRLKIKEFLDSIGKWLECQPITIGDEVKQLTQYPKLSTDTRIIKSIKRSSVGRLDSATADGVENWAINMNLQYENCYDK